MEVFGNNGFKFCIERSPNEGNQQLVFQALRLLLWCFEAGRELTTCPLCAGILFDKLILNDLVFEFDIIENYCLTFPPLE